MNYISNYRYNEIKQTSHKTIFKLAIDPNPLDTLLDVYIILI